MSSVENTWILYTLPEPSTTYYLCQYHLLIGSNQSWLLKYPEPDDLTRELAVIYDSDLAGGDVLRPDGRGGRRRGWGLRVMWW